jgi:3-oxoacyl-(acyl-carrier-protein) synthase
MGAVTKAGFGTESLWSRVLNEQLLVNQGLSRLFPEQETALRKDLGLAGFSDVGSLSRFCLIALSAMNQAMREAGGAPLTSEDGLLIGTTTGNILCWEDGVIASGKTGDLAGALADHEPLGAVLDPICHALNFSGLARLITTACSSSSQTLALGAHWLRSGRVKRCLVGGAEILSRLTVEGFRCLQLLSSQPPTPFDAKRAGINLSEGAAFLCLEAGVSSRALAYVSGYGMSSDAYHMTAPEPEGRGCYEAMQAALKNSGLTSSSINWVYAHGTGSPANDLSEGKAIERLFGESKPWVSSTKGLHGHYLGASGAVETVIGIHALRSQVIPKTTGLQNPDPRISVRHPLQSLREPISHFLKNSLGFGGSNASLVLSHPSAVEGSPR